MTAFKYDTSGMNASETYNAVSSVFTCPGWDVWFGSSDPSIGAPSINYKRVYNHLVHVPGSANDKRTINCGAANPNLSGVPDSGICNVERDAPGPSDQLVRALEDADAGSIVLDEFEHAALVYPHVQSESSLAGATT